MKRRNDFIRAVPPTPSSAEAFPNSLDSADEGAGGTRKPEAHGFTLVELLVVIGIIALLISMLLPALNAARNAAKKISCASDMRQIYQALLMYTQMNKDYLPGPSYTGVGIAQGFPGGKKPDGSSTGYSYYSLAGALIGASHILPEGAYAIFGCPAVSYPDVIPVSIQRYVNTSEYKVDGGVIPTAPSGGPYLPTTAGFAQYAIMPFGLGVTPPVPPRKLSQLGRQFGVSPTEIWLVRDAEPWHGRYKGTSAKLSGVMVPVGTERNWLCADGHVESKANAAAHWWTR